MNNIKKLKKIDKAINIYQDNIHLLRCPVCESSFKIEDRALICEHRHTYNFNKKGYVNFVFKSSDDVYDKDLFKARSIVLQSGLYKHVTDKLSEIIINNFYHYERINILDAGCGEGYYLNTIAQSLNDSNTFIGVDLSAHAIDMATNYENDTLLMLANLANMPIGDHKIDVILNILSPVNYQQFSRILTKHGLVIKVIPNALYLKEIRDKFTTKDFGNEMVISLFKAHFNEYESYDVTKTYPIDKETFENIIDMSPLTSDLSKKTKDTLKQFPSDTITIDMKILVGKKG